MKRSVRIVRKETLENKNVDLSLTFRGTLADLTRMASGTHGTNDQPGTQPRRITVVRYCVLPPSKKITKKTIQTHKTYISRSRSNRMHIDSKKYCVRINANDGNCIIRFTSQKDVNRLKTLIMLHNSRNKDK